MGTPEFAVETLKHIHNSDHEIVGVVTVPDKPAGRGKKIQISAVKEYAMELNLPILQPEKLKDENFLIELRKWDADVFVVVAFRMLPREVWKTPAKGTLNLHASLLPNYRGAAPINWVLINGEKETGNTTFFIDDAIDTGNIILQEKINIKDDADAGTIHDQLMSRGAKLVIETLNQIASEKIETRPQIDLTTDALNLKSAPKIFKEDCKINWNKTSIEIHNLVRGLSPYPAAYAILKTHEGAEHKVKIYKSTPILSSKTTKEPGEIETDGKSFLNVKCMDTMISVDVLQLEGKKKNTIYEFLNGFRAIEGSKFQ